MAAIPKDAGSIILLKDPDDPKLLWVQRSARLAFMGGWIEQVGAELHSPRAVTVGVVASIIMPSESLWRRAAYEMQSPLVGALGFSPFSSASTPSVAMVGYAAVYLAMALALAIRRFGQRDL